MQTTTPGDETPPYASIPVYITAFQSSPVSIYVRTVIIIIIRAGITNTDALALRASFKKFSLVLTLSCAGMID